MNHADHVALLRDGIPPAPTGRPPLWADFGAGSGAFTLALADLLGAGAGIIAIDRDADALRTLRQAVNAAYTECDLRLLHANFRNALTLPPLDGAVMANSLHFVPRHKQEGVVRRIWDALRPGGYLILVEYNSARGTLWAPHTLSDEMWRDLSQRAGFTQTRVVARRPSRHLGEIYSAVCMKPIDAASLGKDVE